MRRIIAVILLLLITLQVSYKGIVFSSYFANKAYIAAVLCENKDKPQLNCEGKCYLKKQLNKTEAPETDTSGLTLKLHISPFTAPAPASDNALAAITAVAAHAVFQESSYRYSFHPACFHPPQV
ncbi:hypothetical protein [Pontibacter sp. H249]|uniref:hypothetical protein n=1 Tax=Pontibacter sp. H249 TaxID=3133420 RepID=UPI0030C1BA61